MTLVMWLSLTVVCGLVVIMFIMGRWQKEQQSKIDVIGTQTQNHDMRLDWLCTSWETLRKSIDTKISRDDLVYCKDCGNLVLKADAIQGPGKIDSRPDPRFKWPVTFMEDYIAYDYFCRRCDEKKPSEPTKVTISSGLESAAIHLHTAYRESWRNALRTLNLDNVLPEDRAFIEKMTGIKLQDEREPNKEGA